MNNVIVPDPYLPCEKMYTCILDDVKSIDFTQIYCSCGRFVDIDSKAFAVKQYLHKTVECSHCRNLRIAKEIELLDEHFSVVETPVYS